jgi:Golgi apparatus protein 1
MELSVVNRNFSLTMVFAFFVLAIGSTLSNAQTKISEQAIAKAEAAITKIRKACAADIKSFCGKVTPGEGRLALCMLAHEDQVSDVCFATVFDVADNIDLAHSNIARAADVCEEEIDKHCSNVELGGGRIAQCLIDKESDLASACRAEVAGIKARVGK